MLFDFNGVLLLDRNWHEEAWNELSKQIRNKEFSRNELEHQVHGRITNDTIKYLLGKSASSDEIENYLNKKENFYQKLALQDKEKFKLNKGSIELFELLDKNNIKKTIATSSPLINIKFYYQYLGLEKWFPYSDIVFDDGTFQGKPAPDIYLIAAKKLNVDIENCLVIEDAKSGVKSAKSAGAGKIFFLTNRDNRDIANKVDVDKILQNLSDILIDDLQNNQESALTI